MSGRDLQVCHWQVELFFLYLVRLPWGGQVWMTKGSTHWLQPVNREERRYDFWWFLPQYVICVYARKSSLIYSLVFVHQETLIKYLLHTRTCVKDKNTVQMSSLTSEGSQTNAEDRWQRLRHERWQYLEVKQWPTQGRKDPQEGQPSHRSCGQNVFSRTPSEPAGLIQRFCTSYLIPSLGEESDIVLDSLFFDSYTTSRRDELRHLQTKAVPSHITQVFHFFDAGVPLPG